MSLALSKTYDPADLAELVPELKTVDLYFTSAREQHPARRWEYAMALRALKTYVKTHTVYVAYDVGGAGSPFSSMCGVQVIDPEEGADLATTVKNNPRLADAVFCISVIEHVHDLDQFLYHLGCLVAPGGLLFLTCDFWDQPGADTAHFHWMRKRIFTQEALLNIMYGKERLHTFDVLGGLADYRYHAPIQEGWGYTFASLALVKRA